MANLSNLLTGQSNLVTDQDLAAVATTGSYSDLTNKPTIPTGSYTDLTNKPTLFSGSYTDLTDKPVVATLKVTSIAYPGDDLAADTAGGQTITLTGTGFTAGLSVLVDTTVASVVTVVSSTQVTFTAPAKTAGTYVLYLVATDGSVALSLPGISYSGTPAWSTSAGTLGTQYETTAISKSLSATGDGTVTYSLLSGTLPTGSTLNSSTGAISGTAPATNSSTTYNFTIRATDSQNQDTDRAFSITLAPDSVTWSNPATNLSITAAPGDAYSQALSAISAASNSVSYTSDQVPAGLTLSGSTLSGNFTTDQTLTSTITATAANSNRTATRTITFTIAIPGDQYFKNVVLLLTGDGTNSAQNNTFLDSSANNYTITRNGNPSQGSFSPYGSNWGNYFNGSSDYLTVPASTVFDFGTGAFTYETWVYVSSTPSQMPLLAWAAGTYKIFRLNPSSINFEANSPEAVSLDINFSSTIVLNSWNHIALVRSGNLLTAFLNGVGGTPVSYTGSVGNSSDVINIGRKSDPTYFSGYMSNLRLVKGTAIYTSNFTPSTIPLTAITNTVLLTCQSNRFKDNSTNNFTVTINGTPSVQRFSPFRSSTVYSANTIGGSAYFDGSGDWLNYTGGPISSSVDFTFSIWFYHIGTMSGNKGIFCASNARFGMLAEVGNIYILASTDIAPSPSVKIPVNQWNHLAITRTSNTLRAFLNGTQVGGSVSNSQALDSFRIGSNEGGEIISNCYMSDARVLIGTGGTSITVPTTPQTVISNTNFLCKFTNSAIFDSAMMHNLETVGNAQVSTSVVKYGTASIFNNGSTGGYLRVQNKSPDLRLGTGDFTVECWMYQTATNTYASILEIGNHIAADGILFISNSGALTMYSGGFYGSAPAPGLNAWHHIAWVRNNGMFRIYVNGIGGNAAVAYTNNLTDTNKITIGNEQNAGGAYSYTGYIDELRVTKGFARYTANFTPPTQAFILQ